MTASSAESTRSADITNDAPVRPPASAWIVLLIAGVFEIGYAVSVGGSEGFTDLNWSISAGVFFFLTVFTLSLALKNIDVGIGYAVWTGIGSSGAAVASSFLFDQPLTALRILWLAVIIAGVVGLKLASSPKLAAPEASGQS